jgi:myo-inositol-1(or 4)-monophosphatase
MISTIDRQLIIDAVKKAGDLALQYQHQVSVDQITKNTGLDFGVQADLESEKIIFDALSKVSFSHRIISEEAGKSGALESDFIVFVDPIDGTVNYAKGIPTFCVSVAVYTKALQPVFSVVYIPHSQELIHAEDNQFFHNHQPVMRRPRIGVPFINFEGSTSSAFEQYAGKIVKHKVRMRMMGCGVLGVTYTALGWGDAGLILDTLSWDVASGLHFCKCMGLVTHSFQGEQVDLLEEKHRFLVYPPEMKQAFNFLLK